MTQKIENLSLPEAGDKILGVKYVETEGALHPFLKIELKNGEKSKKIPVYSVRESSHRELIAQCMTSGEIVVFEAAGVMGCMVAVNRNPTERDDSWAKLTRVKKGRSKQDKVPIMMLPEDQEEIVDFDRLHPNYRYLEDSEKRKNFFGTLPFHAILPLRADVRDINHDVFVTQARDSNKPATVCIYFQGGDKAWRDIGESIKSINPGVHLGISSFNDHGEQPPYDSNELLTHILLKQRVDFESIVRDPIAAKYDIKSSHTQIRLPLTDEQPHIIVVRKGPVSADTISKYTGHPVKILEYAKFASRGHPEHVNLDERVLHYLTEANS